MSRKVSIISGNFSADIRWIKPGFFALCLTLFSMPFPRSWSLYPLGVMLFFGLISWLTDFRTIRDYFLNKLLIIFPLTLYFIIHAVWLIFENNLANVTDKLMFLLVPILAFPVFASKFSMSHIKILLLSFLAGILLICIFQFVRAAYESISITAGEMRFEPLIRPGVSRFNWEQLSPFESPTYITIKALWAFALGLFAHRYLKINKIWLVLFLTLYIIFIYFLAVRAGMLILAILIITFVLSKLRNITHRIVFVLMIPLIFFALFRVMRSNERLNFWIENVKQKVAVEKVDWKNIEPRTRSWYNSMNLIKERPLFGVGLNSTEILAEEHRKQGFMVEADVKLNAHNQYLETQMTFGIPGTIILLWMLLTPLIRRKSLWNPDLVLPFTIIVTISMIFESILVRQWGIMFFVLFYCILTIPDSKTE